MRHRTHKKQNEEVLIHFFLRVVSMHSYCMHARCQSLQLWTFLVHASQQVNNSHQRPTSAIGFQHFNFLSISSSTRPWPEVRGQYRTHVRGQHSTHVRGQHSTHRIRIARCTTSGPTSLTPVLCAANSWELTMHSTNGARRNSCALRLGKQKLVTER
jgi:hypothetical protein